MPTEKGELLAAAIRVLEREAKEVEKPVREAVVKYLERAMRRGGRKSLQEAGDVIERLLDGEQIPLSAITDDLWVASDILAVMQNLEASKKKVVQEWVRLIIQEILNILLRR